MTNYIIPLGIVVKSGRKGLIVMHYNDTHDTMPFMTQA